MTRRARNLRLLFTPWPGAHSNGIQPIEKSPAGEGLDARPITELAGCRELDCRVERILSRSQAKRKRLQPDRADDYRHVCKNVAMDFLTDKQTEYEISLRVVRFEISEGCFENIITNLPDLEFDIEDFKDLYHLRWE